MDYPGLDSMDRPPQASTSGAGGGRVLFSGCKGETHTPRAGFKQLFRRLKTLYRAEKLDAKDDINLDTLSQPGILVLGCPQEPFTAIEFEIIKKFVRNGGSLLVLLAEGGEARAGTNVNYLLEQFGISVNSDSVVRTVHYKYLHPKQVLVQDGLLNRAISAGAKEQQQKGGADSDELGGGGGGGGGGKQPGGGLDFVYPYGASLSVQAPAVPILSTGRICYPINRPIGELLRGSGGGGKGAQLGAVPSPGAARAAARLHVPTERAADGSHATSGSPRRRGVQRGGGRSRGCAGLRAAV
jgi:intraflagellar transport protein 52